MEKNLKVKTKANLEKTSSKLDELEPASPTSEYFLSEVATVYILSIFELEIPIDTSCVYAFFNGVFLNSHPRFSCIPIKGEKGRNMWKKVEVNVEDHIIKGPILPEGLTTEIYSKHLDDYMSKIATTPFQLNKPLWEVHTFNYPTNNATSTLFVKFHHAVGDGISLMGVVFTCLRRVDDPTLPLTFPTKTSNNTSREKQRAIHNVMKTLSVVPRFLSSIFTSVYDFGQTLGVVLFEDECTPIRSGNTNMLLPSLARVCSVTLPLSDVKRIKSLLRATVNDVIIGIISFATQLYIQEIDQRRSNNSGMTASIALNTRSIKGYANPEKMRKGKTWGNRISVIELSLPKYKEEDLKNPLNFIMKVQKLMKRKRKSIGAIYLTAWTLDAIKIFGGFKDILIHQGLHKTLEDKKPDAVEKDKWEDMQLRATSTIRLALAPEIKEDNYCFGRYHGGLIEAERFIKQEGSSINSEGLVAKSSGGKNWKGKKVINPNIKCWYCEEVGHIQTRCSKYKEDLKTLKNVRGGIATIAVDDDY
uniref:Diacylglycerol O-acyltransferase n=1 Tax=Chenopodium quinoa TaxID=63459 RepID=A0A803MLX8_CHEQI